MPIFRGQQMIAVAGTATVIAPGATGGPLYLTKNGAGAPPYSFAGDTDTGVDSSGANTLDLVAGGTTRLSLTTALASLTVPLSVLDGSANALGIQFFSSGYAIGMDGAQLCLCAPASQGVSFRADSPTSSGSNIGRMAYNGGYVSLQFGNAGVGSTFDAAIGRLAAASIFVGAAPSATPTAQTFTLGEASRPATDSNVAGSNGTFKSGLGTGNSAGSSLIFQTPTPAASGTGAQSYTTRLQINDNNISFATAAKGTTDTTGYLTIPSCAGTPTGVPTSIPTGQIPMVFDTTGVKLWLYTGGAWKGVVVS